MNQQLSEIKEALKAATPGLWEWRKKKWTKGDGEYGDGEFNVGELRQKSEPGKSFNSILDIQKNKHGYPEIYAWEEADALLIANAPKWLTSLVSQVEEMQKTLEDIHAKLNNGASHEFEETIHYCLTKSYYTLQSLKGDKP